LEDFGQVTQIVERFFLIFGLELRDLGSGCQNVDVQVEYVYWERSENFVTAVVAIRVPNYLSAMTTCLAKL